MQYTIESLMEAICCEKWPARWREVFDDAMAEYDTYGCRLANPQLYTELEEKYGCFGEELNVFMDAARQTAADEPLARFLTLLGIVIQDREHIMQDCREFKAPSVPEGKEPLAYEMVTGLAFAATMDYTAKICKDRNIPENMERAALTAPQYGVRFFRDRHEGRPGFGLFGWNQRHVDVLLFTIGNLQLEIGSRFRGFARVFANQAGEQMVLADGIRIHRSGMALGNAGYTDEEGSWAADVTETDTAYEGYPVLPDNRTSAQKTVLVKREWQQILCPGDPVIDLHIPARTNLKPEAIEDTMKQICRFLDAHFPEIRTRTFFCLSWLLDPQLETLLGASSNIVHFQKRFRLIPYPHDGRAVLSFVFKNVEENPSIRDFPENTRLEKALKEHYLSGKYIYQPAGYFIYSTENR